MEIVETAERTPSLPFRPPSLLSPSNYVPLLWLGVWGLVWLKLPQCVLSLASGENW